MIAIEVATSAMWRPGPSGAWRAGIKEKVMKFWLCVLCAALAGLALTSDGRAADNLNDLLRCIPDTANTILIIDVQALVKSPRGVKEGWAQKSQTEFLAGAIPLNPKIERGVLATQLGDVNPGESWVVAVAPLKAGMSLENLAKREKGEIEQIGGQNVVYSKRNAYFLEVARGIGGVITPASRQGLSRWMKFVKKNTSPAISPYLKDAAEWPRNGQILLAIDAEDMFHPRALRNWCQHCKGLASNKDDIETVHKLLTSLRGVKFLARVTDSIKGELYLDFQEKVDPRHAALLKPVLIEGLAELGAHIEDFSNTKGRVEGRSVIIEGELSDNALRRILSIIHAPPPSAGDVEEGPVETAANPELVASQRYFKSTQSLIAELKDMNNRASHSGQVIHWYDTYARKIDQLPLVNVDQEMLQYGSAVANKLRQLAASLSGQNIQVNLLGSYKRTEVYGSPGGYYSGWYGGAAWGRSFWAESNAADVYTAKAEAVAKGRNDRNAVWQSIDQDTAEIRRSMAAKYGVDFPVASN
jgi:hypothetical protein